MFQYLFTVRQCRNSLSGFRYHFHLCASIHMGLSGNYEDYTRLCIHNYVTFSEGQRLNFPTFTYLALNLAFTQYANMLHEAPFYITFYFNYMSIFERCDEINNRYRFFSFQMISSYAL